RTVVGPLTGAKERRDRDGDQDGNDQHDDHELDEGEALFVALVAPLNQLLQHFGESPCDGNGWVEPVFPPLRRPRPSRPKKSSRQPGLPSRHRGRGSAPWRCAPAFRRVCLFKSTCSLGRSAHLQADLSGDSSLTRRRGAGGCRPLFAYCVVRYWFTGSCFLPG